MGHDVAKLLDRRIGEVGGVEELDAVSGLRDAVVRAAHALHRPAIERERLAVDDRFVAHVDRAQAGRFVDRPPGELGSDHRDRPATPVGERGELRPHVCTVLGRADRIGRHETHAVAHGVGHDGAPGEEPHLVVTQGEVAEGVAAVLGDHAPCPLAISVMFLWRRAHRVTGREHDPQDSYYERYRGGADGRPDERADGRELLAAPTDQPFDRRGERLAAIDAPTRPHHGHEERGYSRGGDRANRSDERRPSHLGRVRPDLEVSPRDEQGPEHGGCDGGLLEVRSLSDVEQGRNAEEHARGRPRSPQAAPQPARKQRQRDRREDQPARRHLRELDGQGLREPLKSGTQRWSKTADQTDRGDEQRGDRPDAPGPVTDPGSAQGRGVRSRPRRPRRDVSHHRRYRRAWPVASNRETLETGLVVHSALAQPELGAHVAVSADLYPRAAMNPGEHRR